MESTERAAERQRYDAVVIGAGLAGLSAAAWLAKAGRKVAVLEQHDLPGGYYTSFSRQGIVFDITTHWTVDHEKVNRMLVELDAPPVRFVPHRDIGLYIGPGSNGGILLVDNRARFERSILESYPSAKKESIDRLIELALKAEEELRGIPMPGPELASFGLKLWRMVRVLRKLRTVMEYGRVPADAFLESLFPGEELKGLRAALYMIAPIKRIPAIGLLLFIGFALRGRAFLPEGGAIKAGEAFAAAAARHGAEIRYKAKVAGIRVRDGRVHGVTLENGEQIDAGIVVSAADARQTFFRLLDPSLVPAGFKRKLGATPISGTFFLVSLVMDIDPAVLGLNRVDTFITTTADIAKMLAPDDPEHSFFSIQFTEFRDPTARADRFGIQLVAPATFEFRERWATGPGYERTEKYGKLKESFADALIRRVEAYFPGLSRHIVARDIATPITMHRYTLNERGAAVGWSYTSRRSWKQRVPFLKGLYQAGHWVGPSGIYNAASSGRNAAELVLRARP